MHAGVFHPLWVAYLQQPWKTARDVLTPLLEWESPPRCHLYREFLAGPDADRTVEELVRPVLHPQ